MGMLFEINEEGKIDGNDWQAVPEFTGLNEAEFRCVVLVWDNQGAYRRMDLESRMERIGKSILGMGYEKFFNSKKYKEAMWLYRAIDFDLDLNMLDMYQTKLMGLMSLLGQLEMSEDNVIQKRYELVAKNVREYTKMKMEVEERINERGKLRKNFKTILSGIEKFQERARMMKQEHEVFINHRAKSAPSATT